MLVVQVEDEHPFQQAVRKEFRAKQLEVVAFDDAINALNYLEQVEPDILLVDFKLGGPNGLKLATRVRELYPACAIVLISGYATKQDVREAFRNGIDDFLFKPIEMDQLMTEVLDAFRRRRLVCPKNGSDIDTSKEQVVFDENKHTMLWNNQSIKFTTVEFNIVATLAANPDQIFNSNQLYAIATGNQTSADKAQRVIGVHMVNLRQKLMQLGEEHDPIQNIRGKGYKWSTQGGVEE